jgi:predicted nucleic acid-binding protein
MTASRLGPVAFDDAGEEPPAAMGWAESNQVCLVMEFARLRRRLTDAAEDGEEDAITLRLRRVLDPPAAIDQLADAFGLSAFEREIVLLAAGVEMDSALACASRALLGRESRAGAALTFGLALARLDDPHWSALAPDGPLRRYRLIEIDAAQGLTTAGLRLDERALHFLAGVNRLDPRLELLLRSHQSAHPIAGEHAAIAERILATIDFEASEAPLLHLHGDDPRGHEALAMLIAGRTGRELCILPVENLAAVNDAASLDPATCAAQFNALWSREAALLPGLLMVQCGSEVPGALARQLLERLPAPLIVASRDPLRLTRPARRELLDKPSPTGQKALWMAVLGGAVRKPSRAPRGDASLARTVDELAAQFRLSAESIADAGASIGAPLPRIGKDAADRLWSACRAQSRPRLDDLAARIDPAAGWDDLILPEPQTATLKQLCAQARHRLTVHEAWGFAARGRRGLGISALFAGASGTGKTLAAEVLARALRLDLFRIDLSAVVSKYIGESEKNLKRVFDAAEDGGAVLLFDEADALFGKRAEVKDSHDRYANIEVSYLLQRMESFQGIAILTTNLKSSLDKAFQRRLRFSVDFPFPGPAERAAIWRRAFPKTAPTAGLDFARLAQLNMTGGNIRNIALNAAFLAADAGVSIAMEHVLQATRQEAIKAERPLAESEIRGWT